VYGIHVISSISIERVLKTVNKYKNNTNITQTPKLTKLKNKKINNKSG
jgi:hypothetical protein